MNRRRFMFLAVALVALNAFFWLATTGFALPRAIINQFFGNQMVRAEVLLQNGQDWRIDRGVITNIVPSSTGSTITLLERDGTSVDIPVSPTARVQGGRQIRRRMRVVIYHQANTPADLVQVEGVGG
jgi:hypothetical protein